MASTSCGMRCLSCRTALPRKGKRQYCATCWKMFEDQRIVEELEIRWSDDSSSFSLKRGVHGRSKRTRGHP